MPSSTEWRETTGCSSSSAPAEVALRLPGGLRDRIRDHGYALVAADDIGVSPFAATEWGRLCTAWHRLADDGYYGGSGAAFRRRRYSRFSFRPATGDIEELAHEDYYQSTRQNAYVGGIDRAFGPVEPDVWGSPLFRRLVADDFDVFPVPDEYRDCEWTAHVHQIRIVVAPGATTPITPEGVHSDGYPFAAVHLVDRVDVDGGESSVYDADGHPLATAAFVSSLDSLFFRDRDLKHYVTPITGSAAHAPGYRSILAVSFSLPGSPYVVEP